MHIVESFLKLLQRLSCIAIAVVAPIVVGDEKNLYERAIEPLLRQNCQACHRTNRKEGGLNLETQESLLRGGDSGKAVDSTAPQTSLILQRMRSTDPDDQMPPPDNSVGAKRLSEKQIQEFELWLKNGASFSKTTPGRQGERQGKALVPSKVRTAYATSSLGVGKHYVYSQGNEIVLSAFKVPGSNSESPDRILGVAHHDVCYSLGVKESALSNNQPASNSKAESEDQTTDLPRPEDKENEARKEMEELSNLLISTGSSIEAKLWRIAFHEEKPVLELMATIDSQKGRSISERVNAMAFSPSTNQIAIGSGLASRTGHLTVFAIDQAEPTSTTAAAASAGNIRVRDVFIAPECHSDTILAVAFSPDGKKLATASADKFIKIYDTSNWQLERKLEGHLHHVLSIVWHHEGKILVSASADGTIKVWDTLEGQSTKTIALNKEVTDVAFVGKSNRIISSAIDGVARLNDITSNDVVRSFQGAKDALHSVAISADEKTVVAVGEEGLAYSWNIEDGKLIEAGVPSAAPEIQKP
jgi:WD40 repeat protein/mono/diheme cytochrome c family protein